MKTLHHPPIDDQRQLGVTLLEALVSILVLSLGALALLGIQLRTLADTQTGIRRAQAIRLIEDFSERVKVNPDSLLNLNSYVSGWGNIPAAADCNAGPCTHDQLVQFDLRQWKTSVQTLLPLGDASVFIPADEAGAPDQRNRRQLGIMISWRQSEKTNDADYNQPFVAAVQTGGANVQCPTDRICHLQYIGLTQRCTPAPERDRVSGQPVPLYCPA